MTTGIPRLIFDNHFYEEKEKLSFQPASLETLAAKPLPKETATAFIIKFPIHRPSFKGSDSPHS